MENHTRVTLLCCINLIMHRLRVGTDGMHYEIINCNSIDSLVTFADVELKREASVAVSQNL